MNEYEPPELTLMFLNGICIFYSVLVFRVARTVNIKFFPIFQ